MGYMDPEHLRDQGRATSECSTIYITFDEALLPSTAM